MKIKKEYIPQSILPKRKGEMKNEDSSVSTHIMRREKVDGEWVVFPSLFQNDDGKWVDMSKEKNWTNIYSEAKRRGEIISFGEDEQSAIEYADKGSWKEYIPQAVKKRKEYIPQTELNKK